MQVFPGHLPRSHTIKPHVTWSCFMSSLIANKWLWTLKYYWRVEYFHLQNLEISIILSPNLRHSKPRIFQMLLSHNYKFLWITVPTRAVESESEGFSTWGVAVVEKFNDFDSGQTFCSPIVTVCATNVRKRHTGNLGSLTLQLACIHSGVIPDQQRHSGSSRNLCWVNATFRGLRHWHFHLLSFWLALSLLCGVSYVTSNAKFSWELLHCYVTHVTEQW